MNEVIGDLVAARHNAGLSQASVARALGVSRPLIASWERRVITPTLVQLARWGASVGLDVSLRAFPGGAPLRDAGQLRLLTRLRERIGDPWRWLTEVPVTSEATERRAFDAVLTIGDRRVGVEGIVRLRDAQAQVRPILLKQAAAQLSVVVIVLADSRQNRTALAAGAATLRPAFPCSSRSAFAALRRGEVPAANAILLV